MRRMPDGRAPRQRPEPERERCGRRGRRRVARGGNPDHPAQGCLPGAPPLRVLVLVAIVVLFGAVSAPTVWQASSKKNLRTLQVSQNANASDQSVNLSLERVDFSTRGEVITNLPTRVFDVLFKPYPWQVANISQQFGLLGTTVFWLTLVLLIQGLWRNRGHIMDRARPLIYLACFLLIAYSLSAGNAGTAFRYRTHIVAFALCLVVVLRLAPEPRFVRAVRDRAGPRRAYQTVSAG